MCTSSYCRSGKVYKATVARQDVGWHTLFLFVPWAPWSSLLLCPHVIAPMGQSTFGSRLSSETCTRCAPQVPVSWGNSYSYTHAWCPGVDAPSDVLPIGPWVRPFIHIPYRCRTSLDQTAPQGMAFAFTELTGPATAVVVTGATSSVLCLCRKHCTLDALPHKSSH